MPLINGQKMACAPCIRGHRSTKCNHAADRVMVPVRKPGRPLSSCACPPGQSCACGGIKVAIPRKQKCKCGDSDAANGDHDGHDAVKPEARTPAGTPSEMPASPTHKGVFRVQKPASNSRQNGRKQSFDPAHLERIDPNSVNIITQYNSMNVSVPPNGVNAMAAAGPMPVSDMSFVQTQPATAFQQQGILSFAPPVGYALVVPVPLQLNSSGLSMVYKPETERLSVQNRIATPATNGTVRSCCGPTPAPALVPPPQRQPPVATAPTSLPPKRSCCGGNDADEEEQITPNASQQQALTNGSAITQLQPSFAGAKHEQQQRHPFTASYPNPTVFRLPSNYGTWEQPVDPIMWQQLQQATQPQATEAVFSSSIAMAPNGGAQGLDTSHECSCGPGCQCVGCLAHPFNLQTLEYVGGAWDYEMDASYSTPQSPRKHRKTTSVALNGNQVSMAHANDHGAATNGHTTNGVRQPPNTEIGSPTQAQTPSDASGFNEELSSSDFMFVNLPLYPHGDGLGMDPCGGSLAFCPCGDDCQCVGCVIHKSQPLDAGNFGE